MTLKQESVGEGATHAGKCDGSRVRDNKRAFFQRSALRRDYGKEAPGIFLTYFIHELAPIFLVF